MRTRIRIKYKICSESGSETLCLTYLFVTSSLSLPGQAVVMEELVLDTLGEDNLVLHASGGEEHHGVSFLLADANSEDCDSRGLTVNGETTLPVYESGTLVTSSEGNYVQVIEY
jgi:hypothetical protein